MILRALTAALICFVFSACAHIPIERTTAIQAQSSFVLIHQLAVFQPVCDPNFEGCTETGPLAVPTGSGSGGVVGHGKSSTYVLTAKHVVSSFYDKPELNKPILQKLILSYASRTGISPEEVFDQFLVKSIRFVPKKIEFYAAFSVNKPLPVDAIDCDSTNDICLIRVPYSVDVARILPSETPPYPGQTVRCTSAPFGTAAPALGAVPIFEGVFSGYDIKTEEYPVYAWYTMNSAPGSSGALILSERGELIGVVIGISMGQFCDRRGCIPMRSGVTAAVPHSVIVEFLSERLK